MTAWLGLIPAIAAAIALITLPGTFLSWALRLRGLTFIAAAVAGSLAIVALASIIAPLLGMSWGIGPVLLVTFAAGLVLTFTRFLKPDRGRAPVPWFSLRNTITYGAALAIAFLLVTWTLVQGMMAPENISQIYDGVFHLNAVQHILVTEDASPFHMALATHLPETTFYPTAWHASVALIAQISGASVPAATNALSIVAAAWIWPVAILFFARPFFVSRRAHVFAGAILATAFATFPYSFLYWGVLYPNLLSFSLIPIALGFLHLALRHRHRTEPITLLASWVAFAGATGAAAFAHPNAILTIIALATPLLLVTIWDVVRLTPNTASRVVRISGIALTFVLCGFIWSTITTGDSNRTYEASIPGAIVAIVGTTPFLETRGWFLALLVLTGIGILIYTRRHRWIIASYFIVVGLYVVVTSFEGPVRDLFTIAWYNDGYRIAAMLPIVALPLAARAAAGIIDLVHSGLEHSFRNSKSRTALRRSVAFTTVIILALLTAAARAPIDHAVEQSLRNVFRFDEQSEILTPDELELFQRLPESVPEDALIASNPRNGSALAYLFGERAVLFPHLKGNYSPAATELATIFPLDDARTCELLTDIGVTHMLGSSGFIYFSHTSTFTGLDDLENSDLLTEIDREGDAALYEVTGC